MTPGFFKDVEKANDNIKQDLEHLGEKALGALVNPVVECTDVDGIVRRIDVNDVVGKFDNNEQKCVFVSVIL